MNTFPTATKRSLAALAALAAMWMSAAAAPAGDAPGGPGLPSNWAPAAKDFLGTSATDVSRVYFTGAQGVLTEIFYPTLDRVQNVDLQFLVTDASGAWGDEERRQRRHDIRQIHPRAMAWEITTRADNDRWTLVKRVFSDPARNSVIERVTFASTGPDGRVYLLNNPAIDNTGGGEGRDRGQDVSRTVTAGRRVLLVASEPGGAASAVGVSRPWRTENGRLMVSHGFVGRSDGFTDLLGGAADRRMDWAYEKAAGGNVAQMGWIDLGTGGVQTASFDVVIGFGANEAEAIAAACGTMDDDLAAVEKRYTEEWIAHAAGLDPKGDAADPLYYLAAMTLKCMQDKSNGAMIAGPGTPWGEANGDGNQGGYHLVWARDLFKFASALIAAGDTNSANRAVDYLFNVQMQTAESDQPYARPGRFPQNTFVDGRPWWNATQMDQCAMPIILAWKLGRDDLWPKIRLAAEFVARVGPRTDQDRWEEMAGYSPSTIAAEVAGLVCAADLAARKGEKELAAAWRRKADEWRNGVAHWTFTTTGPHGDGRYYLRITENQDPNDGAKPTFGNGAGAFDERAVVDGGFLELVRMGLMGPGDWTIAETLPEYDAVLRQDLPGKGPAWFRYNVDGYGEDNDGWPYDGSGRGRLWPIFTAERGLYEIARTGRAAAGAPYRAALKAFASPAGFIPEQVWNRSARVAGWETITPAGRRPGEATGSIRPLSWAMGEYINLVAAMHSGRSDAPSVVVERYASDRPSAAVTFEVTAETKWGENLRLVGNHPLLGDWCPEAGVPLSPAKYPVWSVIVSLPASAAFEYKYAKRRDDGSVAWEEGENRTLATPALGAEKRVEEFR